MAYTFQIIVIFSAADGLVIGIFFIFISRRHRPHYRTAVTNYGHTGFKQWRSIPDSFAARIVFPPQPSDSPILVI